MGNLSDLGYAAQLPRGTWIRTDQDLTIAGTETQTTNIGGTDYADSIHAFALIDPPQDAEFTYGVTRDTSVTPFTVPAKTAIVPGSQGLLPAPLLPGQLPIPPGVDLTNAAFFEQLAIDQGNFALGAVEKINRATNDVAIITDPLGGFGYFPAEVTMHPLFNHPVTRGSNPAIANRYATLTSAPTRNNGRTSVQPYPISSGNKPITPTSLRVDGIISMPVGTKFYYPPGTKIPLGPYSFNHGTSNRVISPGANPNAVIGNTIGTADRVLVHLPAGAVLGNVTVPANSILPDGSVLSTARFFERMTLTHGGALSFDQLLHYDDGNISQLPLTNEQAAFRIEAMGMNLTENAFATTLLTLLARNASGTITLREISTVANSDGYQLFPYHDAVIAKSRSLNPVSDITLGNPRTLSYTSLATTYLDNPISRAQLSIYNFGANLSVTVTISPAANRSVLSTITEPSYALVDELGVGVEAATDGSAALSVASTIDIIDVISPITLNYDQGVEMQANPGRLYHNPTSISNTITVATTTTIAGVTSTIDVTSTVTVVNNYLAFNQFGPQETNTPLVAPFTPGQESFSTSLTDSLLNVFRLTTTVTLDPGGSPVTSTVADTISIDPRSAEIALHLDQETTLNTFTSTSLAPAPSDRISLGEQLDISRRVFLSLRSDAVLHDSDAAAVKTIVPAGVRAEFGVLERSVYDDTNDRFSHHFVPGGRVFSGVGFYPLSTRNSTALRFNRDQASFLGPTTITIGVVTDVQPAVPPLDITIFYGTNAVSSTIISDPLLLTNLVVSDPQLIIPAGVDFTAGTYDEAFSLDSGATTITVYLFDNDLALVGSSMMIVDTVTSTTVTLANPLLKPPQDPDPNGNASMFITIDDTDDTFNDTDDEQNLAFTFVANGSGAVVSDALGRVGRIDRVNDGQVVRLRLAPDQVNYTDGTEDQGPELQPLLELAWSGVDSELEHIDFVPDSLIFNQNNPLFYAVAPDCRKDLAVDGEDCTDDENAGLNVQVLAGEEVRLPEPSVTPPGLLIYGFRNPRHEPDQLQAIHVNAASTTTTTVTATVAGVRIRTNGMVDFLNLDPTASNVLTVDTSITTTAASGTTLELIPGTRGVQFQYESDETLTSFTLASPINPSATRGYTEPLSIFVGGFTYENLVYADYRQTISAASTITLGTGSQIFKDDENIRNSLYFAPGSSFDSSGTATDGSDLFLINGDTGGIEVVLAADAARESAGLGLPQPYATSGETITIGQCRCKYDHCRCGNC